MEYEKSQNGKRKESPHDNPINTLHIFLVLVINILSDFASILISINVKIKN